MIVRPQGPVSRREGFLFIYDITSLIGVDDMSINPRMISFEFDKDNTYAIVLFYYSALVEGVITRTARAVFGTGEGLVEDPDSPGNPYTYEFTGIFEIESIVFKQSADIIYIAQPNRTPIEFKRLAHDEWSANEAVLADAPLDWGEETGYPQFVDFYEQRICYASTWERPQTIWFSKSGDFYDFGKTEVETIASDAVTLTLDSGTQNKIRWTSTSKQILVGTAGDEWAISGSGYEPLSFASNRTARHTNVGSEKMPAIMIGNVTLFIQKHGRKVNQFIFDFNADSYDAIDLSVLAPHLTENNSIVSWAYQQEPYGIVWCVLDNGEMIAITFKREHKVAGWHVHDTQGKFLEVCCVPGNREDDVWAIVERTVGVTKKWYLEKKSPEFKSNSVLDCVFLDSCGIYEGIAADIISVGSHLEGMEVEILADGGVVVNKTVIEGIIRLDTPASKVVYGLPYVSDVEPTLLDLVMDNGTSLGRMLRVTWVDVMLYKSLLFEYGTYEGDELRVVEELPFLFPHDPTGRQIPLFTGLKQFDFPEGYDPQTRILVRQRRPLPLTLIAMIDTVEVYG